MAFVLKMAALVTRACSKKVRFLCPLAALQRRLSELESLNLREGQSRPGTGFGLGPIFWGMVWTHFAIFSLKICGETKT